MSMTFFRQSELYRNTFPNSIAFLFSKHLEVCLMLILKKECGGHYSVLAILPVEAEDPCQPNPCGSYSAPPVARGSQCDCSCLPRMIGSPPNCRPECVYHSDCPTDKACKNQACVDPCPGLCGRNANCNVRNHVPYCICQTGYVGDPFTSCQKPSKSTSEKSVGFCFHFYSGEAN